MPSMAHIRIEIIHGSQNVFWILTWNGRILVNVITRFRSIYAEYGISYMTYMVIWILKLLFYVFHCIAINTPNTYANEYRNRSIHYHSLVLCFVQLSPRPPMSFIIHVLVIEIKWKTKSILHCQKSSKIKEIVTKYRYHLSS
jgi:hypothetical protein